MESFLSSHVRALLSKSSTSIDNNQTSLECVTPQTSCDVTPITLLDVTSQTSLECVTPQSSYDVTPQTSLDVTSQTSLDVTSQTLHDVTPQTSLKYVTRQNVFDEESIKQNLLPDFDLADLDQSKWKQGSAVNGTFSMFVVVN